MIDDSAVLFLLRVLEHRRRRDALLCGLFLVVAALVYPPFAAFDVILAGVLVAAEAARRAGAAAGQRPSAGLAPSEMSLAFENIGRQWSSLVNSERPTVASLPSMDEAEMTPTSSPAALSAGPPESPGQIEASSRNRLALSASR